MNTERHNDPDSLESALDELRHQGDLLHPSPEALDRTRAAVSAAGQRTPGARLAERITHMRSWKKPLAVAAAAAAVIIALAVWMYLPGASTGGVVFADVQRQIEQTQTLTLTSSAQMKGIKKPITMKLFFKYPGLMRQEMTIEPEAFLPAGMSRPASMPEGQKVIGISNITEGKVLSLVPGQKQAMIINIKNLPPEAIARAKQENILDSLKKAVAGEHQELGEKKINGVLAKGYRCKSPEMEQVMMDIWVGASSAKPLVVEQTMPESFGGIKTTMTNFEINPVLDDSLFDMKVPEGYAVQSQVMDANVTEDDLIKGLGVMATTWGGVFPKSLIPTPDSIKELMMQEKKKAEDVEAKAKESGTPLTATQKSAMTQAAEATGKELGMQLQKIMLFQIKTMQGGEFVYAGDGVKLGDNATPILWYKAKDAKTYRVIYGDLHVEDAQTPPARPATQPVGP